MKENHEPPFENLLEFFFVSKFIELIVELVKIFKVCNPKSATILRNLELFWNKL